MVTVKVTETYDMKTTINKLGIIGIHTPSMALLNKLYPGLIKNHKFVRFKKCDVFGACASVLPADPLQVGVGSGEVAPEDMFNPILYKAVSNDSFDSLVSRIYDSVNTTDVIERTGSINSQELDISASDAFKVYYSLLSEPKTWRKSMPQTGFSIRGLYPIAHTLVSQYGNVKKPHTGTFEDVLNDLDSIPDSLGDVPFAVPNLTADTNGTSITSNSLVFRGRSVKMPRMPLHYQIEGNIQVNHLPEFPKTFVGCMIVPPAKLHEFYYRMRVTWTVSFEQLCSTLQYAPIAGFTQVADASYAKEYTYESSKSELPNQTDSVDADSVSIEKIMES